MPELADLNRQTQEFHHRHYPDLFASPSANDADYYYYFENYLRPPSALKRLSRLQNPFTSRKGYALGWVSEGKLRAYILYYANKVATKANQNDQWNIHISDIAVSPDYQSQGVGKALMHQLLDQTSKLGKCQYFATIYEQNAASMALFEKHGFTQVSKHYHLGHNFNGNQKNKDGAR